MIMIIIIRSKQ